jgi:hypothetical protein
MTSGGRGDSQQVAAQLEKVPARRSLVIVGERGDLRIENRGVAALGTPPRREMKRRHVRALQLRREIHDRTAHANALLRFSLYEEYSYDYRK